MRFFAESSGFDQSPSGASDHAARVKVVVA